MPRKKWITKFNSTTYQLVHRPQNDPRIHDASSSSMVFQELAPSQSHKVKSRRDLESELFGSSETTNGATQGMRDNEGEAAEQGIYFDDTEYNYMQHVRNLSAGNGDGDSYFIEAATKKKDRKDKGKTSLEDALREASMQEESAANRRVGLLLQDMDLLPSNSLKDVTYQDQQDVPDTLAGFQPDMDPRLREVLEALDDEAYADDEEDFFGEIVKDGKEVSLEEFEDTGFPGDGADNAGWQTDETEKPSREYKTGGMLSPATNDANTIMEGGPDHGDGDWIKEFSKFKQENNPGKPKQRAYNPELSSILTKDSTLSRQRKKRKGAMTSITSFSMTSSSLVRTDGQALLDARFDKIEEDYAEDKIDMGDGFSSTIIGSPFAPSQAPPLTTRSDFDNMMDEFLGDYSLSGEKRVKRGAYQSAMEQLDEIRKGLGPPRVKSQKV